MRTARTWSVQVSLMSMMVLEGWQFRLAEDLPIFDSVKVALGGFGAAVFLQSFKDRILGATGNIAGQLESKREEIWNQDRQRQLDAALALGSPDPGARQGEGGKS